ncbi:MAG: GGDEF domain-containing protein, partial [Pseudomonadota bacterium]
MPEKLRLIRALATVVGAMNLVFMIFDYRVSGGIWSTTLSVRALLEGVVVLGLLSTWSPHIGRWLDDLTSVLILSIGGSISVMLYHSSAHDIARETYYAALLLVVFGLCSIVPLSRRRLLVLSVLLIGSYGLAATHHPAAVLLVQLFLMVCCAVLGIAARETRERYAQENFRLRYLLEQDARRKDEEVERIAHLAEHDALTGLPNRTRFYRETQSLLQDAARHRQKLAILFID